MTRYLTGDMIHGASASLFWADEGSTQITWALEMNLCQITVADKEENKAE